MKKLPLCETFPVVAPNGIVILMMNIGDEMLVVFPLLCAVLIEQNNEEEK